MTVIVIAGLALGISGAVSASSSNSPFQPNAQTKAAILIFVAAFLFVAACLMYLSSQISNLPRSEKELLYVVAFCVPFLAARLTYTLVSDFGNNSGFNALTGNVTIYLFMDVLEEIIVALVCVMALLRLLRLHSRASLDEVDVEHVRRRVRKTP